MAATWKTIVVRVERPPEASLAEFFVDMRSWLDHRCIIPAEFKGVTLANKGGVFDVLFDNPREALLFGRRFGAESMGSDPVLIPSRQPTVATGASIAERRVSLPAAIASSIRSVFWATSPRRPSAGQTDVSPSAT